MATTYRIVGAKEAEQESVVEIRLQQYNDELHIEARQIGEKWIRLAFFDKNGVLQADIVWEYLQEFLPGLKFRNEFIKIEF